MSKGKEIRYTELKTQLYLLSGTNLTTQDQKQIYLIRTRSIDCKANFPSKFGFDKKCIIDSCLAEDNQKHIYKTSCYNSQNTSNNLMINQLKYEDIYRDNLEKQLNVKNIFFKKYKQREKLISSQKRSSEWRKS